MKTTLNIPDQLLNEARRVSGKKTKTATIVEALETLVANKKIEKVLHSAGTLDFDDQEQARHAR